MGSREKEFGRIQSERPIRLPTPQNLCAEVLVAEQPILVTLTAPDEPEAWIMSLAG
jgi:hypothetical protein